MNGPQGTRKFIYFFGAGQAEAGNEKKHLVGGKGASLGEMTRANLNVPPGFTISAECCDLYFKGEQSWPVGLEEEVKSNLGRLQGLAGRAFGQGGDPLLLAVRSGAAHSMPGMMDTVLNVGLNPACVRAMGERTANPKGAWEAYRHFLVLFGKTVAGISEALFSEWIADYLRKLGPLTLPSPPQKGRGWGEGHHEEDLDAGQMEILCERLLAGYRAVAGKDLPTEPWDLLVQAINAVFRSWNNDRAVAYRRHHRIDGLLGTAVNIQMMCPSEVSGVMFTANPVNPALEQILIESSFGLGEAIVLGKVTPDRFVVDKGSLQIIEREIAVKEHIVATLSPDGAMHCGPRDAASLNNDQVIELARLGMRVESYFGMPCDIEWGLSQGQYYLLQARAIKSWKEPAPPPGPEQEDGLADQQPLTAAELEQVRHEEIATLRARAEPGGTVWSRYNLAEVLPEPTPMTWSIVRRFMSGKGGFGQMYRDLGFDPDPALDEEGIFDLVCGRPYCNLSREPRMQYRSLPFEHPFTALKANPNRALYPQAELNPARAGWRFWLFLPVVFFKLVRSGLRLRRMSATFAGRFREEIIPAFVAEVGRDATQDLTVLENGVLLDRLHRSIQRTLFDFARDSLKPTLLSGVALGNLERALARGFARKRASQVNTADRQHAEAALRELVMGVHPNTETDLPGAIRDLAAGRLDRSTFLQRFGHRGSQEMELSKPRWSEDHAALDKLTGSCQAGNSGFPGVPSPGQDEIDFHDRWNRLADEAGLTPAQRAELEAELKTLHTYLGLRETAKHYLMLGYFQIRRILLELDRRYQLDQGIFFLTLEELPRLISQPTPVLEKELAGLISKRRRRRELTLSLQVPQVLFSDDLEAIGRQEEMAVAGVFQGVPLSAGTAEGNALVLEHADAAAVPGEPYILVCPSTDPAWVPLFVKARALVMETGGVLSHGAIVAREFGLPAVAGLPHIQHRIRTGQRLCVDGSTGQVKILA